MRPCRDLIAWQTSHDLALEVWALTAAYPTEERFVLVPQMRHTARSIPANLAEGSGRKSSKAFRHHIDIACGSSSELEYDFLLSRDLGILTHADHDLLQRRVAEVRKIMLALAASRRP